jgi:predicted PurR-regulated permease PerM
VGVHPVLVLLSLFVFGSLFGIIGLLVAVPTTALLATVYRAYQEKITPELSTYNETASS